MLTAFRPDIVTMETLLLEVVATWFCNRISVCELGTVFKAGSPKWNGYAAQYTEPLSLSLEVTVIEVLVVVRVVLFMTGAVSISLKPTVRIRIAELENSVDVLQPRMTQGEIVNGL